MKNISTAQYRAYNFEKLNTGHGLSSNIINSILQDRDGFYWIGTVDGLNRFDGTTFLIFRNDKNDSSSLIHNYVTQLVEADNGDIWIGTYNGTSVYQKKTGKFKNYTLQADGIETSILNRIIGLAKDKSGLIWLATRGLWLYDSLQDYFRQIPLQFYPQGNRYYELFNLQYDPLRHGLWFRTWELLYFFSIADQTLHSYYNNPWKWKIFNRPFSSAFVLDRHNRLWFYQDTMQELQTFHIAENKIEKTGIKIQNPVRRMKYDACDRVWVMLSTGKSFLYDSKSGSVDTIFFNPVHRYSAATGYFTDLFIDRQGYYWIGSPQGISIFRPDLQFFEVFPLQDVNTGSQPSDFSHNVMTLKDDHHIYIGHKEKLILYNLQSRQYQKIHLPYPDINIKSLYYLKTKNQLWIGGLDEVLIYDVIKNNIVRQIPVRRFPFFIIPFAGSMWVGTWANGLYQINYRGEILEYYSREGKGKNFLKSNSLITAFAYNNTLWLGFNGGQGMASLQSGDSLFNFLNIEKSPQVASQLGTITAITFDLNGNFWAGTYGGGIYGFDKRTNNYFQYLQSDGLRSDFIFNIIPDSLNNLWICHSKGVDYFLSDIKKFIPLPIELSFINIDFKNAALTGTKGQLFFHNNDMLVRIQTPWIQSDDSLSTPVISGFKVFGKDIPLGSLSQGIFLSHKENFFSIEFSKLRTNPGISVEYAYILEGFDQDWVYTTASNIASYTNVPPGRYVFRVKNRTGNGQWSQAELSVRLSIAPPFWKTWWFYLIAALLFSALLWAVFRYRIKQVKKLLNMRIKISQDLHDEIGSALSSIHIYSSVASRAMEKENEMEKARAALKNINENTRIVMENMSDIVWAIHAGQLSGSTLEAKLKNYGYDLLSPLNIQCAYHIDKEAEYKLVNLEARKNLLLIAKEAMNNIAKYSEATRVTFTLVIRNGQLLLEIGDNGKGISAENRRNGQGLLNMQQRAAQLGGRFECLSDSGMGTRIRCFIPITNIRE